MNTHINSSLRRISLILLSLILLFSLSGCYLLPQEEKTLAAPEINVEAITYDTELVSTSDIERWETGTGTFVSRFSESYSFEDEGILKKIYVKPGQTVKAGDLLAELDTESIDDKIEYQEYITEKARLSYNNASSGGAGSYGAQIAKLDYDYQQKQLDKLYSQRTQSALYAGFDGIVTYASSMSQGDVVAEDKILVSIADQTAIELQYVPKNMKDLYIGMEVTITPRNSDKSYTGVISQTPAEIPDDADDIDKTCIYISIENAGLEEVPDIGASAYVEVLLERKENVIVISLKNLFSTNNRYYVRVLENDIPEERDVTVGINNGTKVEITGGLEIGEKLVI